MSTWGRGVTLTADRFLYVALFIVIPAWNAVGSLTFALYILAPFYPDCECPRLATQLLASSAICESISSSPVLLLTRVTQVF